MARRVLGREIFDKRVTRPASGAIGIDRACEVEVACRGSTEASQNTVEKIVANNNYALAA